MAADRIRTRAFPCELAGRRVECSDERVAALIADQHHFAIRKYRRCSHPIRVVERSQTGGPKFAARVIIGQQPEIRKEHNDSATIDRGTWGRRTIAIVEVLLTIARRLP